MREAAVQIESRAKSKALGKIHRPFFGNPLGPSFPRCSVNAKGEAAGVFFFLSCFGFFFSRLLFCWPFANSSSYLLSGSIKVKRGPPHDTVAYRHGLPRLGAGSTQA
jgi:hypothetical protein